VESSNPSEPRGTEEEERAKRMQKRNSGEGADGGPKKACKGESHFFKKRGELSTARTRKKKKKGGTNGKKGEKSLDSTRSNMNIGDLRSCYWGASSFGREKGKGGISSPKERGKKKRVENIYFLFCFREKGRLVQDFPLLVGGDP